MFCWILRLLQYFLLGFIIQVAEIPPKNRAGIKRFLRNFQLWFLQKFLLGNSWDFFENFWGIVPKMLLEFVQESLVKSARKSCWDSSDSWKSCKSSWRIPISRCCRLLSWTPLKVLRKIAKEALGKFSGGITKGISIGILEKISGHRGIIQESIWILQRNFWSNPSKHF